MRTQIEILTNPDGNEIIEETVEAVVKDGLAIHRTSSMSGLWKWRWTVTHVQSGMAVLSGLPTPKDAYELVSNISSLADWNQSVASIMNSFSIQTIREIVKFHSEKVVDADCGNQYL